MLNIAQFMEAYQQAVQSAFGGRVVFIGLQGSYGRGEAAEQSDIDVVLILDAVSMEDLKWYREAVADLPHRELLCGFVAGREELAGWSRADYFQFYFDTTAYYGCLDTVSPRPAAEDAREAMRMGAGNLYHLCSHSFLHHPDWALLKGLYKTAFFVMQAKYFLETGTYCRRRDVLWTKLSGKDLEIAKLAKRISTAPETPERFDEAAECLLDWSGCLLRSLAVEKGVF